VHHIHLPPLGLLSRLALVGLLSACGSGPSDEDVNLDAQPGSDAQVSFPEFDASVAQVPVSTGTSTSPVRPGSSSGTTSSSSTSTTAASSSDAGTRPSAAGSDASAQSGSADIDGLIGDLFGDSDGGFKPPPGDGGASGDWKLEPDSDQDCPPEPPPIPIVGGACLGLYYTCNWRNSAGDTYFCTCDWVHWLCV
jgi:hypothetical protein